jgi:Tfp pilus assembly protein PilE
MMSPKQQTGATLVVSMIMLVVVTVLVVFSIRSGNTNLRIAGNMQSQTEAFMATQQVIEQVIEQIKVTENIGQIAAQTLVVPAAGGVTYRVAVAPMGSCVMEVPILNSDLNPSVPDDVPCIESSDSDQVIKADGTLTAKLAACKNQWWEVRADVSEGTSGVQSTQVQGLSVRAPATVSCL